MSILLVVSGLIILGLLVVVVILATRSMDRAFKIEIQTVYLKEFKAEIERLKKVNAELRDFTNDLIKGNSL